CRGEAVGGELARRFYERLPGAELYNLYGPTEAAIDVTWWRCVRGEEGSVPIGRPISNTEMYVLDGQMQPVPIGVSGEVHIGGVQVCQGYWGRAALTAERFVPSPLKKGRLYKTGGVGRWRSDGVLEYQGRLDHQVKVRGYRIELGEIESAIRRGAGVRDAVVQVREEGGDKRIVEYVVVEEGWSREGHLERLRQELPH